MNSFCQGSPVIEFSSMNALKISILLYVYIVVLLLRVLDMFLNKLLHFDDHFTSVLFELTTRNMGSLQ